MYNECKVLKWSQGYVGARMHQITDFFRIVEMKKDDLFGYKHLQSIHTGTQDKFMNIHKMQMQHVQSVEP